MTIDDIKKWNEQYYNHEARTSWESRNVIKKKDISVPVYIGESCRDHDTEIFEVVMKTPEKYRNKKFLDVGTGAGINNLLLTREGFHVEGIDNDLYSINASLYAMEINNLYYKVTLADHTCISSYDYDVLILNQLGYIPEFYKNITPILREEREKGKIILRYT